MRIRKHYIIFGIILVFCFLTLKYLLSITSHTKIDFELFEIMESRDVKGLGSPMANEKWFLVSNYKSNTANHAKIDSFVCSLIEPNALHFDSNRKEDRRVYFFKKTSKTNSEYIRKNPSDLFRHSMVEDFICKYVFKPSGNASIYYYEEGRNTSQVKFKCH